MGRDRQSNSDQYRKSERLSRPVPAGESPPGRRRRKYSKRRRNSASCSPSRSFEEKTHNSLQRQCSSRDRDRQKDNKERGGSREEKRHRRHIRRSRSRDREDRKEKHHTPSKSPERKGNRHRGHSRKESYGEYAGRPNFLSAERPGVREPRNVVKKPSGLSGFSHANQDLGSFAEEARGNQNGKLDFAILIPGYEGMNGVQQLKARTRLLLERNSTQAKGGKGTEAGEPWTRFIFLKDSYEDLPDDNEEEAVTLNSAIGASTLRPTPASRQEQAALKATADAHEAAMFAPLAREDPNLELSDSPELPAQRNLINGTSGVHKGLGLADKEHSDKEPTPGKMAMRGVSAAVAEGQKALSWREWALQLKRSRETGGS